ncbi:hypothetical protein SUDANB5_06806 [Streptomyces sp. SudanB5_2050]
MSFVPRTAGTPCRRLLAGAFGTVLDNPATRTRDIGGTLGTADFAAEIRRTIEHTGEAA